MSDLAIGAASSISGMGSGVSVHQFGGATALDPGVQSGADPLSSTFKQLVDALHGIDGEQAALDGTARRMQVEGAQVTPGELVALTMQCDEFMFHCELTSNAANRSSDGLQQLFREQS